ncbi:MAG: PilZ domain-containing protein [Polyangia bacterium]
MSMSKTSGPRKQDARHYPRYELFASVKLRKGMDTRVFSARNVSMGGLFLSVDDGSLELFRIGDKVNIELFDALDAGRGISSLAQVVRSEAYGIGLRWGSTDPDVAGKVAALLERLSPLPH